MCLFVCLFVFVIFTVTFDHFSASLLIKVLIKKNTESTFLWEIGTLYIYYHITLKGKYHWPTYMLRKQTQHITNCDLYTSNPLEKDLTGKCRDGKFLQPLGVWWRGQFLRACDSHSPSSQSGKVLTLADQLTQRHNDVPEVTVLIYS